jgi:hypothetical protein
MLYVRASVFNVRKSPVLPVTQFLFRSKFAFICVYTSRFMASYIHTCSFTLQDILFIDTILSRNIFSEIYKYDMSKVIAQIVLLLTSVLKECYTCWHDSQKELGSSLRHRPIQTFAVYKRHTDQSSTSMIDV